MENIENKVEEAVEAEVKEAPVAQEAQADKAQAPAQRNYRQMPRRKRKVCIFCQDKIDHVDYKDVARLRKCTSERSKILPRRVTGTCAFHQHQLTTAVKRARQIALMSYTSD